jgi:anti-sigma factor RsiW
MLTCKQLTELVTDYLEGRLPLGQRIALQMHLGMCAHCRTYLRQMRATVRALGKMPNQPPPSDVREALMARWRSMHPRGAARPVAPAALRLLAAIEMLAGGARGWVAAGLAGLGAFGLALSLGLHSGRAGQGMRCFAIEVMAGVVPAVVLGLLALSRRSRLSPQALLSVAAAGGLTGTVFLQATCPGAHTTQHVVVFHLGGLLVAALVALGTSQLPVLR